MNPEWPQDIIATSFELKSFLWFANKVSCLLGWKWGEFSEEGAYLGLLSASHSCKIVIVENTWSSLETLARAVRTWMQRDIPVISLNKKSDTGKETIRLWDGTVIGVYDHKQLFEAVRSILDSQQ
jgi:hypothetical protein